MESIVWNLVFPQDTILLTVPSNKKEKRMVGGWAKTEASFVSCRGRIYLLMYSSGLAEGKVE